MSKVWSSKSTMNADEVWDDTELIKMYDESIKELYTQEQASSGVQEKTFKATDGTVYTWKVGEKCMAPYEEDGTTTDYAAVIDWIGKDTSDVGVTFIYYGNSATVQIGDLWYNKEAIAEAVEHENREKQQKSTSEVRGVADVHEPSSQPAAPSLLNFKNLPVPTIPPPVPPNILAYAPANDQEAFNSMLMSWYMSGYHTGYYQGRLDRRGQGN